MWYAVWVRTGQEEKVLELCRKTLRDRGMFKDCFLPKYEKVKKENGVYAKKKELLFPGYLFFISDQIRQLGSELRKLPEFARILGDGEGAVPLYEHEVEFLKRYTNEEYVLEMSCGYLTGKRLVVTDGPLKDYQGKIVHIDRHRRIAVLELEFFGRPVKIKVGLEVVRKVPEKNGDI